jgi:hypothetical protein
LRPGIAGWVSPAYRRPTAMAEYVPSPLPTVDELVRTLGDHLRAGRTRAFVEQVRHLTLYPPTVAASGVVENAVTALKPAATETEDNKGLRAAYAYAHALLLSTGRCGSARVVDALSSRGRADNGDVTMAAHRDAALKLWCAATAAAGGGADAAEAPHGTIAGGIAGATERGEAPGGAGMVLGGGGPMLACAVSPPRSPTPHARRSVARAALPGARAALPGRGVAVYVERGAAAATLAPASRSHLLLGWLQRRQTRAPARPRQQGVGAHACGTGGHHARVAGRRVVLGHGGRHANRHRRDRPCVSFHARIAWTRAPATSAGRPGWW